MRVALVGEHAEADEHDVREEDDAAHAEEVDKFKKINEQLKAIDKTGDADAMKTLQKVPLYASFAGELLALFAMKPVDSGSIDITGVPESDPAFMY